MKLEPLHQIFRPLFGEERRETAARFLYAIIIGILIVNSAIIVLRLLSGATLLNSTTLRLLIECLSPIHLLIAVKRGFINSAALTLAGVTWISATYQAWAQMGA
jgi:hypothetical protein